MLLFNEELESSKKKILILSGDAVEALEIFYPYYRFIEEGFDVDIAAPSVKKLNTVVHDGYKGWDTFKEMNAYQISSNKSFSEINPANYDALFIPGGRAPEYIRMEEDIPEILNHFMKKGKPVGMICHGCMLFSVKPELIKGREITGYFACKPEVELTGAKWIDKKYHAEGNLVSGHAWDDLPMVLRGFMKLIN